MKKIIYYLTVSAVVLFIAVSAAIYLSLKWLDSQDMPIISSHKTPLKISYYAYRYFYKNCNEKCIANTIKITNLLAHSADLKKSHAKSINNIKDILLLLDYTISQKKLPDMTAKFELSLEKLLFFNRASYLSLIYGKTLDDYGIHQNANRLKIYAHDQETLLVLERENILYKIIRSDKPSLILADKNDEGDPSLPEKYNSILYGLALCAKNDPGGQKIARQGVDYFSKNYVPYLPYIVTRNFDIPIIQSAKATKICDDVVSDFLETIRKKK